MPLSVATDYTVRRSTSKDKKRQETYFYQLGTFSLCIEEVKITEHRDIVVTVDPHS